MLGPPKTTSMQHNSLEASALENHQVKTPSGLCYSLSHQKYTNFYTRTKLSRNVNTWQSQWSNFRTWHALAAQVLQYFKTTVWTDCKIHIFSCPVKLSKSCSLHLHRRIFQPVHVRRSFSLRRSPAASQRKACCRNQTTVLQIYSKRQYAQSLKK